VQIVEKIPYCGVAGILIEGNNYRLVLGGSNSHLAATEVVDEEELQYAQ